MTSAGSTTALSPCSSRVSRELLHERIRREARRRTADEGPGPDDEDRETP
ncbi:hypothetical protein [Streptomyces sp. M54]|nr:hypothetical protein [Streptomyces sp. M54]